jgi:ATP/maltotriose-dependent transcriptional regulator MalT
MTTERLTDQQIDDGREYEALSPRELEVMLLYSNPYFEYSFICDQLSISMATLKTHINHIFDKLEETDRYTASIRFFKIYPDHRKILEDLFNNL